jgi:putative holliday junction resolvase
MRWMALDHGTRNIGIAFCDELEIIPSPFAVWPNEGEATLARLVRLAREEGAQALLVGLPCHKDGAESATAPLARALGEALRDAAKLPLRFCSEYLTSVEAERLLAQRGVKAKDRKAKLDSASAAVMLQDLIEHRRSLRIPPERFGPDA